MSNLKNEESELPSLLVTETKVHLSIYVGLMKLESDIFFNHDPWDGHYLVNMADIF